MTPYEQISEKINAGEYENKVAYPDKADSDRQAKLEAYHKADHKRVLCLRKDLELVFGTGRLRPAKRNLLWDKAWEHGHAEGLSEVLYWYDEFVQFTK